MTICVTSLAFWLYGAPDLRFGQQFFWVLFAISTFPIISYFISKYNKTAWIVIYLAILLFSLNMGEYFPHLTEIPEVLTLKSEESRPVKAIIASPEGEEPPLILWLPISGDQCGNSQLPCSTEKRVIKQRVPGDISKGFLPAN